MIVFLASNMLSLEASVGQALRALDGTGGPLGPPWVILVMPPVMHVRIHIGNLLKTYSLGGTGGPLGGPLMAAPGSYW